MPSNVARPGVATHVAPAAALIYYLSRVSISRGPFLLGAWVSLACLDLASCGHSGATEADTPFARRIAFHRRMVDSIPSCDPGVKATAALDIPDDTRVTLAGHLELEIGICEQVAQAVARNLTRRANGDPLQLNSTASGGLECKRCVRDSPQWSLMRTERWTSPTPLSLTAIKRPISAQVDCDGRAFAAAMGDRLVMVTGRYPARPTTPPVATAATEATIMQPVRVLTVESICYAQPAEPAPSDD